ncbi:MAG: hypothetical protein LBV38_05740 [Alistipes sp.]|jgi:hypothetical protein|nr:hypothetical protein [Alistipes sp.]
MKNLFFAIAGLVLCVAVVSGYKVYDNITMTDLEKLTKQNVEALAGIPEDEIALCSTDCSLEWCGFLYINGPRYWAYCG